ncbi:hypothetical protein Q4534_16885 [Cyclobacterium sp. 1_MG-2023]|uniref:hypothetical protein n=1 Tax=Cyclobacterium sp. 1_MG-2023 TaxID=3062681 RepID=UPI0026E44D00|nr:hypothetical protein [Cyclobacterium sp. 1_MG-2023]MDO6439099.1 hypothetical protein [Cyclobacterium sp. 1_MG-2023]
MKTSTILHNVVSTGSTTGIVSLSKATVSIKTSTIIHMSDYYEVAKIGLDDSPQLLESLGKMVRS